MSFAIVRFVKEDDAPGIIATNWLCDDKNSCFYPNVGSEMQKNKLLIARAAPDNKWIKCPVIVLKEFSNYKAARSCLTEAEYTSNLDSDSDAGKKRKKRKRNIRLPGEMSSSSEDEFLAEKNLKISTKKCNFFPDSSLPLPLPPPPPPPPPAHLDVQEASVSLLQGYTQAHLSTSSTSKDSKIKQLETEVDKLKVNQELAWESIKSLAETSKEINQKLDRILTAISIIPNIEKNQESSEQLMSCLPANFEDFETLNTKITENASFRRNLLHILMTARGKDCKAMVANCLRKIMTDDVAENYSLTGKHLKTSHAKISFEKTPIYRLITDACFQVHKSSKDNIIREAMSDWLLQAKFRKSRREKRKNEEVEETNNNFDFNFDLM